MNVPVKTMNAPSLLMDPEIFNHMQRVGSMLAMSPLFPDHLRKGDRDSAIANGVLVMNMAARLNEDPLTVAQNIYFVGGKPGWSSSYMIGKANQHGVFKDPIAWEIKGKGDDLSVTAYAEVKSTGKRVEATCDMAMARAEGWTKNAKYKSMPEQMLRYRSATFLIRLYCPEVMIGIPSQVEVELGMKDVTPADAAYQAQREEPVKEEPQDAEIVESTAANESVEQSTSSNDDASTDEPAQQSSADRVDTKAVNREPDISQFENFRSMIEADMQDGAPWSDIEGMYGVQIEQMKASAPAVFEKLMEQKEAFEKAAAEKADSGE